MFLLLALLALLFGHLGWAVLFLIIHLLIA
jgi:hypothetical protein